MMHWWWDGGSMPWFGMLFGPIAMIAVPVIIVLAIVYAVRGFGPSGPASSSRSSLDILKDRFARGEIDRAEYEERKRVLSAP